MNIQVMNFSRKTCYKKVGRVIVRYGDLILKCDLVYTNKFEKAWIRMPEMWLKGEKNSFCHWPDKEKSEEFQKEVLNQLVQKYDMHLDNIKGLYTKWVEKRNNSRQNQDKQLT